MSQFIYPYLLFENTLEASEYYKKIFDGEVTYTMMGSDAPDCPPDQKDSVYHLQLKFQGNEVYMADYLDKEKMEIGNALLLMLDYDNKEAMEKAFNNMAASGTVIQKLGETFWGAIFGIIKDKFGYQWEFHYSIPRNEKE